MEIMTTAAPNLPKIWIRLPNVQTIVQGLVPVWVNPVRLAPNSHI